METEAGTTQPRVLLLCTTNLIRLRQGGANPIMDPNHPIEVLIYGQICELRPSSTLLLS